MIWRVDRDDVAETAAVLRAVVDGAVRAEDVTTDPIELAYLHGAADALGQVADQRPDFLKLGPGARDGDSGASPQDADSH